MPFGLTMMAAVAIGAAAQVPPEAARARGGIDPRTAQRVDQGIADVGPLATSLVDMGVDLRRPDGFADVFRLGSEAGEGLAGRFARVDGGGGLVAVYPRGRYIETRRGLFAEIPPDTIYVLGGVGSAPSFRSDEPAAGPAGDSGVQSLRVDSFIPALRPGRGLEALPPGGTRISEPVPPERLAQQRRERIAGLTDSVARLFADEQYRAQRVGNLLPTGR